jgi:hypothetical protein
METINGIIYTDAEADELVRLVREERLSWLVAEADRLEGEFQHRHRLADELVRAELGCGVDSLIQMLEAVKGLGNLTGEIAKCQQMQWQVVGGLWVPGEEQVAEMERRRRCEVENEVNPGGY